MVLLKLAVAWFAASMLYYGIMFSASADILFNNFIYGVLSTLAAPATVLLMARFKNRRTLLAGMYVIPALAVLVMALMAHSSV